MRYLDEKVYDTLARLNAELVEQGDPARVRYASVRPDPYLPDEWLVIATWELPDPSAGQETWPLEQVDKYDVRARERLAELSCSVLCLYRTSDEIAEAQQLGSRIPELV